MRTRRDVLELGICALAAAAVACNRLPSTSIPEGAIVVPLSELPEGVHVMRMRESEPLDLLRQGSEVIARSLFCTHMGCIVRWDGETNGFKCPCHGGAYDAGGLPLTGPPPSPLWRLPVTMEGERVIVAPRPSASPKSST